MYNKLFSKILDSSVWLESQPTRIVWLTLLAAMDQDGFAQFSAIGNVATRARVTDDEARSALLCLESPDDESNDPDHNGRRIERIQGGWIVLNAKKYRDLVTRSIAREQTRQRVAKYRANRDGNGPVTVSDDLVTPSETEAYTEAEKIKTPARTERALAPDDFEKAWKAYPRKTGKGAALKAWQKAQPSLLDVLSAIHWQSRQPQWTKDDGQFVPHMSTWLNQRRWEDEPFHPLETDTPVTDWAEECARDHGSACDSRYTHGLRPAVRRTENQ